jgi:diacylglycerol kinase family enzyme
MDKDRSDPGVPTAAPPAVSAARPRGSGAASRRLCALGSLLAAATALGLGILLSAENFPNGLTVLACLAVAAVAGWYALRGGRVARGAGAAVAALALTGAIVLVITEGRLGVDVAIVAAVLLALTCARAAFRIRVRLPSAPPPQRAVLFYNPKSGGGKAERFALAEEAARRGIAAVELRRGQDLGELVLAAVGDGADGLAMAGGDGSQAIVAAIAAEHGLPYACIPAGTRNHFALDLGVDRDDVVGALDAFVDGGERIVDLATVNGRVFVNNVSLGLYAEAVQRPEYRDAKLRTLAAALPEAIGPDAPPPQLSWNGPDGGSSGSLLLVSNNRYRLGRAIASGTRPRLDSGVLGIAAVAAPELAGSGRPEIQQWTGSEFEVSAPNPVPAGIDGEAAVLDPPLRFRSVPASLRVRIAPAHPGASPSAAIPETPGAAMLALLRLAAGRPPDGAG